MQWHHDMYGQRFFLAMAVVLISQAQVNGNDPARPNDRNAMISSLISTNQPPELIKNTDKVLLRYGVSRLPLFPARFDWANQGEIRAAVVKLGRDESILMFDELLRHINDTRYCITILKGSGDPENYSVGKMCRDLARGKLVGAFQDDLGLDDRYLPARIPYGKGEFSDLVKWREKRPTLTLAELQIEVGQLTLDAIPNAPHLSEDRKVAIRVQIQRKIDTIKSTGKPITVHFWKDSFSTFTPKQANEIREHAYRHFR